MKTSIFNDGENLFGGNNFLALIPILLFYLVDLNIYTLKKNSSLSARRSTTLKFASSKFSATKVPQEPTCWSIKKLVGKLEPILCFTILEGEGAGTCLEVCVRAWRYGWRLGRAGRFESTCAGLKVKARRRQALCMMWARAWREWARRRCWAASWSWSKQRWALHEAWAAQAETRAGPGVTWAARWSMGKRRWALLAGAGLRRSVQAGLAPFAWGPDNSK
ncbi:unnamed protein product [Prunus armeniaca]